MALLHFPLAGVKAEFEAVRAASAWSEPYSGLPAAPALWLVGDEGIYLMGNDKGRVPECGGGRPVVYAAECPRGDGEAKRRLFGGDDGVEAIPAREVEVWIVAAETMKRDTLSLRITDEAITCVLWLPQGEAA